MPSDKQLLKFQRKLAKNAPELVQMKIGDRMRASWYFDSVFEKIMLIAGQVALVYVIFWLLLPKAVGFFSK